MIQEEKHLMDTLAQCIKDLACMTGGGTAAALVDGKFLHGRLRTVYEQANYVQDQLRGV